MPRPKRARRAPPAPVAVAPEAKSSPAPASGSDIYSHSDREHSVIRKELEQEDGGEPSRLAGGGSTRLGRGASLRQRQALEKSVRARDEAMGRLEDELDTTSSKAKTSSDRHQKSDSPVELELGRKTRATPVQHRRDTTGLDLDDDMFEGLDTTLGDDDDVDDAAPPSAPRSDTSTFSVSHFRRRGRAPSISINKDDAPIRPSSRGVGSTPGISSTFNIGMFKRRRREPSILGTAQKERAQRPIELSSGPESDDEEGDDFEPEAESTPLQNKRKSQPLPATTEPESESQQVLAPDSQPVQKEAELSSSTASRKRKSMESHEETDRPVKTSRTEAEAEADADAESVPGLGDDDSDSELSELPSPVLTPTRPSAFPRPVTPNRDEIMAPPESSDSENSDEAWPDIHTLTKQRRRRASPATPTRDGNVSDASSPPSLTHSPNFPATRNKSRQKKQAKSAKSAKVTTADLTGLLPRRRHKKARDPYSADDTEDEDEIDAPSIPEHDDELSYADTRTRSRRTKITPLDRVTANRPASRGGKTTAAAEKSKAARRSSTRTYSRRLSNKENEGTVEDETEVEGEAEAGADGDSFAPVQDDALESQESSDPARSADELKKAARKFKEVDRWELEFEEMTEASSPNRDAR